MGHSDGDQHTTYTEFKDQLQQNTQSWYFAHWSSLLSKLQHDPALFKEYDDKIKEKFDYKTEKILYSTQARSKIISQNN